MYSPDDQGEYTSLDETPRFSLEGLSDTLVDIGEGTGKTSVEEYALMLEVTMADHPDQPRPPAFQENAGMVMHILKSNLVPHELEHVRMALVLLTCSSMISRDVGVWSGRPQMLSEPTWRRPFRSGSHSLPTSMSASSP